MAHIHEKIDFVSNVFIVNGDAVLLRKHDKYKVWLPPGGHIELDEDPAEAAVREMKEEVGLNVTLIGSTQTAPNQSGKYLENDGRDIIVPHFINRHRINETHEHISFEYLGTSSTREIIQGDSEVSEDIKWFTYEMLEDESYDIPERIAAYAKKALEVLGS